MDKSKQLSPIDELTARIEALEQRVKELEKRRSVGDTSALGMRT